MRYKEVTAQIEGKPHLFVFTMSTYRFFSKYVGVEASNIQECFTGMNMLTSQVAMVYSAYLMGFSAQGLPMPEQINQIQAEKLIDSMEQSEYDKVLKVFVESMTVPKEPNEKKKEVTPKKKPVGMK